MAACFAGAGAVAGEAKWSQSDAVCPGTFVIEQRCDIEFGSAASCIAMGTAAAQPVRLRIDKAIRVMRGIMGEFFPEYTSGLADFPHPGLSYFPADFRKSSKQRNPTTG